MGEKERIGPAPILIALLQTDQTGIKLGRRDPIAHEPMSNRLGVHLAYLSQRAHHQLVRHPDAKCSRDKFVPDKELTGVHFRPCSEYSLTLTWFIHILQGK